MTIFMNINHSAHRTYVLPEGGDSDILLLEKVGSIDIWENDRRGDALARNGCQNIARNKPAVASFFSLLLHAHVDLCCRGLIGSSVKHSSFGIPVGIRFLRSLRQKRGVFPKRLFDFGMILENQNFILPRPQLPASHHSQYLT